MPDVFKRSLHTLIPVLLAAPFALLGGCSIQRLAVNKIADALAEPGEVFTGDNDPELVGDALPFALKTFEILLEKSPKHEKLLLTTCQAFTQYSYAYVELEAARLEPTDYRKSKEERERALKLYLRGREYCFRALDVRVPGTREKLITAPREAVAAFGKDDVGLLVWTAMSWAAAISNGLDKPELVVDVPSVRALVERGLELDPAYGRGLLQDAALAMEALPETMGGSIERARAHFEKSLELHGGRRPSTYIYWASMVSVRQQNRKEFEEMLNKALAIDPDDLPEERLATLIAQKWARLLLDQVDDLFL